MFDDFVDDFDDPCEDDGWEAWKAGLDDSRFIIRGYGQRERRERD